MVRVRARSSLGTLVVCQQERHGSARTDQLLWQALPLTGIAPLQSRRSLDGPRGNGVHLWGHALSMQCTVPSLPRKSTISLPHSCTRSGSVPTLSLSAAGGAAVAGQEQSSGTRWVHPEPLAGCQAAASPAAYHMFRRYPLRPLSSLRRLATRESSAPLGGGVCVCV